MEDADGRKYLTREEFFAFLQEDRRRWEENQKTIERLERTIQRGLSKIGARLGIKLEGFSRELINTFLAQNGVKKNNVRRLVLKDEKGEVFGQPDYIEIDLFMKDPLVVGEITSYLSEKDKLYTFQKKALFVEKTLSKRAKLKFIACLDVDPDKKKNMYALAKKLRIKIVKED